MYLLLGRKRITNAKKKTIPKNSLFYFISYSRGSVTLYATVVAGVLHGIKAPLTLDPYVFCLCRKVSKRAHSRPTVLSIPLCRRLSMTLYEQEYYFSHSYSLANCRFHSLRQYLGCDSFFDYASHALLYFRLYCSLANEVRL